MSPNPPPPAPESADLFDYALLRDWARFVLGAVRRRRPLVVGVWLLVVTAAAAALWAMPRTWHTETKILAQRNQVIAALGNPQRAVPYEADAPTRAASETVMRQDNLVALIKQTNLVDHWQAHRAPALAWKDAAMQLVRGPPTEEDRLDALLGLLEKRLSVTTGDGTVVIAIDWPDAQMAHRLVEAAQQNFLEARHATEVSTIAEAISILEGHAASVRESMDAALAEVQRARGQRAGGQDGAPRARTAADQDRAQVEVMLNAKRRAIADLEEFRRRRLAELQIQLAEQRATYAPAHPTLVNTEETIAALNQDSPQLAALRREERELADELVRRTAAARAAQAAQDAARAGAVPASGGGEGGTTALAADTAAAAEYAQTQLRIASAKYEELLGRIDAARIELDTARAAFKYRYSVVKPSQVPKKPEKPNVPAVLMAGAVAGLLLAVACAVWADARSGRVLERWQLERQLGLEVLAEVRR